MPRSGKYYYLLTGALCAAYVLGELLSAIYYEKIVSLREAHNFHRVLIISGEQVPVFEARKPGGFNEEDRGLQGDATQFLSPTTLNWVAGRPFVTSVHLWTVQAWDARIGSARIPVLSVYGIGAKDIKTFRLGDQDAISSGALVLSRSAQVDVDLADVRNVTLTAPEDILAQLPNDVAKAFREGSSTVVQLSDSLLADPPGLRPGRSVAYVDRDGDQFSGLLKPAALYLVLVEEGYDLRDAAAEIQAYLGQFQQPTSLGVRAVVRTVDQYFPPVVKIDDVRDWMRMVRITLIAGFLAVGFSVAWLKLRQHAFEIALRRALGATGGQAFMSVYGAWIGAVVLACLGGAVPVWLAWVALGPFSQMTQSMITLSASFAAMLLGTAAIGWKSMRNDPLRELAGGR